MLSFSVWWGFFGFFSPNEKMGENRDIVILNYFLSLASSFVYMPFLKLRMQLLEKGHLFIIKNILYFIL